MDNFDFKKFLMENKLGAYSKIREVENPSKEVDPEDPYGTGPLQGGLFQEDEETSQANLEAEKEYVEDLIEKIKAAYPNLASKIYLFSHRDQSNRGKLLGYGIGYQGVDARGAEMDTKGIKVDIVDLPTKDKVSIGNSGYLPKAPFRKQVTTDAGRRIPVPMNSTMSIGDGRSDIAQALFVVSKPENV